MTGQSILAGLALIAAMPVHATDADVREITRLEDAWRQARIDGDVAFLETFYAKEFRVQNMAGEVQSRADDIGMFARRDIRPEYIRHGPLDISVYGDTAIVTGRDELKGTYRGTPGTLALRFTDVLVRRDGRWQLVLQQATPTK